MLSHFAALNGDGKKRKWFVCLLCSSFFQLSHSVECTLLMKAAHTHVLICSTSKSKCSTTVGAGCPLPLDVWPGELTLKRKQSFTRLLRSKHKSFDEQMFLFLVIILELKCHYHVKRREELKCWECDYRCLQYCHCVELSRPVRFCVAVVLDPRVLAC